MFGSFKHKALMLFLLWGLIWGLMGDGWGLRPAEAAPFAVQPSGFPFVSPSTAPSPAGSSSPAPAASPSPEGSGEDASLWPPKVIDRITVPDAYPNFSFSDDDDLLEVWFPGVRDQDCTIFLYQDEVWMVDCGDERARVEIVPLLKYLGIEKIDRLFNTHPHHDHLNGLSWIHSEVPVEELLICFPEDSTEHMTAAMEYCKGNGIPITSFEDESVFGMGDGLVSFLTWLKVPEEETINDRSAQFMVTYGQCRMLIMADIELRGQRILYEAMDPASFAADILRYPHHGKIHMVDDLFSAIHPALAIISNPPRIVEIRDATYFLDKKHVPIAFTRRTPWLLHLVTDGTHWLCEEIAPDLSPWTPPE